MILNRDGASFEYAGVTYTVGGPVIGTDASEYHGLYFSMCGEEQSRI